MVDGGTVDNVPIDIAREIGGTRLIVVNVGEPLVSEDKLVSGNDQSGQGGNDQTKALDIINNPDNPEHKAYHDPAHPMHKRSVGMVQTFLERHSKRTGKQ